MTSWEGGGEDGVERALSALRGHDADRERVERIRQLCLEELATQPRRAQAWAARVGAWRGWLEPALALGFGAVYLASAVARALAVYR